MYIYIFLEFDNKYNIIDIQEGFKIDHSNISCGVLLANGLNIQEYIFNENGYYETLCLLNNNIVLLRINYENKELICNIRYHILKKLLLQIRIKKDLSFVMINPLNSKILIVLLKL